MKIQQSAQQPVKQCILCGNVYMYVSGKKNIRAIESPPVQLYIAIFELVVPFDHMIMP